MNRITAGSSNALTTILQNKNLYNRTPVITGLIGLNVGFYALYKFSSGPKQSRMRRALTLQAEGSPTCMATMHFCHTSLMPLLFNTAILFTVGNAHVLTYGLTSFATIYGASCGAGALNAAYDMRSNQTQSQAGGMAGSAGLLAYQCFRNPKWFNNFPGKSMGFFFGFLVYSMMYNDKAALGGVGAGYAAFLLAL